MTTRLGKPSNLHRTVLAAANILDRNLGNAEEVTDQNVTTAAPTTQNDNQDNSEKFQWTLFTAKISILLFIAAGAAEICGGWMVWSAVRGNSNGRKPWWMAIIGSAVLVVYGFIPTLQPTDSFGRIYAVYGGFFIVLSFAFGWILDGDKPDTGDVVGSAIALIGVLTTQFWPR